MFPILARFPESVNLSEARQILLSSLDTAGVNPENAPETVRV